MAGYIASLKDSLRTLTGCTRRDTPAGSERVLVTEENCPVQPVLSLSEMSELLIQRSRLWSSEEDVPAMADEVKGMATTVQGLALAAAAVAAAPVVAKENFLQRFEHGFVSVLDSFGKGVDMALEYIIQYTPSAAKLADLILPGYQALIDGSAAVVEAVAVLLRNAVLEAEKAFGATVGTGAQKLASVLDTLTSPVLAILKAVKINVNADWVKAAVNAVVGALKLQPFTAPATA